MLIDLEEEDRTWGVLIDPEDEDRIRGVLTDLDELEFMVLFERSFLWLAPWLILFTERPLFTLGLMLLELLELFTLFTLFPLLRLLLPCPLLIVEVLFRLVSPELRPLFDLATGLLLFIALRDELPEDTSLLEPLL